MILERIKLLKIVEGTIMMNSRLLQKLFQKLPLKYINKRNPSVQVRLYTDKFQKVIKPSLKRVINQIKMAT